MEHQRPQTGGLIPRPTSSMGIDAREVVIPDGALRASRSGAPKVRIEIMPGTPARSLQEENAAMRRRILGSLGGPGGCGVRP